MQDFKGKCVVITGGGSGIGHALASAFADHDAEVFITGRNAEKLAEASAGNPNISSIVCDVTQDEEILELRDKLVAQGGIDILVNNAGVMNLIDFSNSIPIERQFQEIAINAAGPVRMVHHLLPELLKSESTIVNISSGLAYVPFAVAPIYSATKSFLHSYTLSLRGQLANENVQVIEVLPPVVDTPMAAGTAESLPRMSPEKLANQVLRGIAKGTLEITPGFSSRLKLLSRLSPKLAFYLLNK